MQETLSGVTFKRNKAEGITFVLTLIHAYTYTGDLSYNGLVFHSPAISLCFITITTSVTPVSHTPDLQLHWISPTFSNS
jgi:hypothetical protein